MGDKSSSNKGNAVVGSGGGGASASSGKPPSGNAVVGSGGGGASADPGSIKGKIIMEFTRWYIEYTLVLNNLSKEPKPFINYSAPGGPVVAYRPATGQFSDRCEAAGGAIIDRFVSFYNSQKGGAITYILGDESILKPFMGNPFPADGIPDRDNVIILGGGPNGLFLATILKAAMPDLIVSVVENRVDDAGARLLTRTGKIHLPDSVSALTRLSDKVFGEFISIINTVAPGIGDIIMAKNQYKLYLSFNGLFNSSEIKTNQVELHYAVLAQSLGVNIFHDKNSISNVGKYINSKTLCFFDATGGRFRPLQPIWDKFIIIDEAKSRAEAAGEFRKLTGELRYRESIGLVKPFTVYEGYLPPELAVNDERGIPYVAIGDTAIRTNYKNGAGLYFNCFLSTFYAILLARIRNIPTDPATMGARSELIAQAKRDAAAAAIRGDERLEEERIRVAESARVRERVNLDQKRFRAELAELAEREKIEKAEKKRIEEAARQERDRIEEAAKQAIIEKYKGRSPVDRSRIIKGSVDNLCIPGDNKKIMEITYVDPSPPYYISGKYTDSKLFMYKKSEEVFECPSESEGGRRKNRHKTNRKKRFRRRTTKRYM